MSWSYEDEQDYRREQYQHDVHYFDWLADLEEEKEKGANTGSSGHRMVGESKCDTEMGAGKDGRGEDSPTLDCAANAGSMVPPV